ncbi:MAG: VOC family protein [Terracidiphilus sp.]|jgi:predicted enzyme related to lactoylglutathione lyase
MTPEVAFPSQSVIIISQSVIIRKWAEKIIFCWLFIGFGRASPFKVALIFTYEEIAYMPHAHPVVHSEILGKDKKLLEEFYKGVFYWEINPLMDSYSLVKPGSGINGGIGAMGDDRQHVTFYVAVADVNAALALIESKGGKKAFGPHPIPDGGIIAGFTDPEGHLIGLVQGPK